jgi:hypothetical protein
MRAAGQDYLYEGWVSHAAPGQTQSCLCPGLLLTGTITAYWHIWRPAVRGQERWRLWVSWRRRRATAAPRHSVLDAL